MLGGSSPANACRRGNLDLYAALIHSQLIQSRDDFYCVKITPGLSAILFLEIKSRGSFILQSSFSILHMERVN